VSYLKKLLWLFSIRYLPVVRLLAPAIVIRETYLRILPLDLRCVVLPVVTDLTLYSVAVELRRSLVIRSEHIDEDRMEAADLRLPPVKVPPPLEDVVVAELSDLENSASWTGERDGANK